MIRFADIAKRLNQQYDEDDKQLLKNYSEQNALRPSVIRFHDLEREAKAREERMARIISILGDEKFDDTLKDLRRGEDVSKKIAVNTYERLPLWMAMQAILEQTGEILVIDLQDALEYFKMKASRQAIESALASHKEIFETKMRTGDKFVSLKR
ncbi:MAG TPA: hypothetical protein VMG31_12580 [Verrucomicrobiae bacterium]|nr:hypothetical protein [Verrucomicrobiae bacterium]